MAVDIDFYKRTSQILNMLLERFKLKYVTLSSNIERAFILFLRNNMDDFLE